MIQAIFVTQTGHIHVVVQEWTTRKSRFTVLSSIAGSDVGKVTLAPESNGRSECEGQPNNRLVVRRVEML